MSAKMNLETSDVSPYLRALDELSGALSRVRAYALDVEERFAPFCLSEGPATSHPGDSEVKASCQAVNALTALLYEVLVTEQTLQRVLRNAQV